MCDTENWEDEEERGRAMEDGMPSVSSVVEADSVPSEAGVAAMSRTDPETADVDSSEPIVSITVSAPAEASPVTPRVGSWTSTAVDRSALLLIACSRDREMLLLIVATQEKDELGSLTSALGFAALRF